MLQRRARLLVTAAALDLLTPIRPELRAVLALPALVQELADRFLVLEARFGPSRFTWRPDVEDCLVEKPLNFYDSVAGQTREGVR